MIEIIEQPYWSYISSMCKIKIAKKYSEYKNNWKFTGSLKFWNEKLQEEVDEVKEKCDYDRIEELLDVINICAMEISNRLDAKQQARAQLRWDD